MEKLHLKEEDEQLDEKEVKFLKVRLTLVFTLIKMVPHTTWVEKTITPPMELVDEQATTIVVVENTSLVIHQEKVLVEL